MPSLDALRDFVAAEHPRSWAPRRLLVVDDLPMLVTRARSTAAVCPTWSRASRDERRASLSPEVREVEVFSLPMNVRFRRVEHREGVLIRGAAGVGEFSPFWDYDVAESAAWLAAALEAADQPLPCAGA